jgi:hypothetical protein
MLRLGNVGVWSKCAGSDDIRLASASASANISVDPRLRLANQKLPFIQLLSGDGN